MKKTNAVSIVLSAACIVALAGCEGQDESSVAIAARMSKALGIPVNLNGYASTDDCVNQELVQVEDEFSGLPQSQQSAMVAHFQSLKSIEINGAQTSQTITGKVYYLEYYTQACNGYGCTNNVQGTNVLEDDRQYDGAPPVLQLSGSAGSSLSMTPQTLADKSDRFTYGTSDVQVYSNVHEYQSDAFMQSLENGSIQLMNEQAAVTYTCSPTVGLAGVSSAF